VEELIPDLKVGVAFEHVKGLERLDVIVRA